MRTVLFSCDKCDADYKITLKDNLSIDGNLLRCTVCGGNKFSYIDEEVSGKKEVKP